MIGDQNINGCALATKLNLQDSARERGESKQEPLALFRVAKTVSRVRINTN